MKGLNICDIFVLKEEGHWSEDYIKKAALWGAQILRVPIHPGNYRKYGKNQFFILLDEAIKWSKKYGMYMIIDWHSEGNLFTGKFLLPGDAYQTTKEETKLFWKSVAERYKNEPAAAFYEIFNEPAALFWIGDRLNWSDWRIIADEIINEIFAVNPDAIPVVGGLGFASRSTLF